MAATPLGIIGTEAKDATSMWQRLRDQRRVGPRQPAPPGKRPPSQRRAAAYNYIVKLSSKKLFKN